MGAFKQFLIKESYHIFRDYRTLMVLFGMPIIQVILFGYAIRTEIQNADIGILDKSKDYVTQKIINKLTSSGYFIIKEYFTSEKDIEAAFRSGKVKQVVVFEPNFAENLARKFSAKIQILNDASNPNVASLMNTYTSTIIADYNRIYARSSSAMINPEVKMLYNPEMKSVNMFVPGLIAFILMLVSALMTSITITREKEVGTMEILLVSPLKPITIIIGKVLPYLVLAFINALTILVLAMLVFGIPFKGSYVVLLLETILFVLTALSLGILISTISKTQQAAMMMALAGLLMPTMLLSGFVYPIENMPLILQYISNIIPARWFLTIIKAIMLKGVSFEYFWKETLVLLGMMLLFMSVSVLKFKIRLE